MVRPKLQKYRVVRKVCRRFCFELFEVEARSTQERFFLKLLDRRLATQGLHVYNFLNTARMSRFLRNEHVVKVRHYGQEGRYFVVLTEVVPYKTLSMFVHESFPLELNRVANIVTCLCRVLRETHLQGVVHGLLNPNCVYISDDGNTILVDDFGYGWLAPYFSELDEAEANYLAYHMAPEMFRTPARIDGRADIYSLGVLLLQLLTDQVPFNYLEAPALQSQRITLSLHTLRKTLPNFPPPLEEVILKTLHPDPERRYQNMKELEAGVQEISKAPHARSLVD